MDKKSVEQLLMNIDDFSRARKLSRREIAQELNIPWNTFRAWFQKKGRKSPSRAYIEKIERFLESQKEMPQKLVTEKMAKTLDFEIPSFDSIIQEAQRKTEKIKCILLFLEEELRWFRDGSKEARNVFREKLDLGDMGYISSLLTMLGDEDKFKRWLTLTTNRFNFFKKQRGYK